MKQNQFTQAAEDLSKLEVELSRLGYQNKTHNGSGEWAGVLGMLWNRAVFADNSAELLNWENEKRNNRAAKFWKEYHGWVAVVKQLVIAEAEIANAEPMSYSEANADRINEYEMWGEAGRPRAY